MMRLVLLLLLCGHMAFALLTIGSFNIQRLSVDKVADRTVLDAIVRVLLRYDIAVIEEVLHRDAINIVLSELNKHGHPYSLSLSGSLGRTSYKEHLAILYRSDLLSLRGTYQYSDSNDRFEREPYAVSFHTTHSRVTDFAVMGVHLKPEDVRSEMDALVDVATYAMSTRALNTQNLLIAGDFNADCRYLSDTAYVHSDLYTDGRFTFLLNKDGDSTTNHNTDCAYDRFVVAGSEMRSAATGATIFNLETRLHISYDQALKISDHYPVEIQLH